MQSDFDLTIGPAFAAELAQSDAEISVARAGLLFARSEYPALDCGWYLGQLDLISSAVAGRAASEPSALWRLKHLVAYLFRELDYHGNLDEYYDPRNSFLNEVIDRRTGIPITLSIVFIEVARRLGIEATGVSFPGHYLVSVNLGPRTLIVDAFDRGAMIERDAFLARLRERVEEGTDAFEPADVDDALTPANNRETLLRLLRNLKVIYHKASAPEKTLNVLNHMMVVDPMQHGERLERARLLEQLDCDHAAAADYEFVLANAGSLDPFELDLMDVDERLTALRGRLGPLH